MVSKITGQNTNFLHCQVHIPLWDSGKKVFCSVLFRSLYVQIQTYKARNKKITPLTFYFQVCPEFWLLFILMATHHCTSSHALHKAGLLLIYIYWQKDWAEVSPPCLASLLGHSFLHVSHLRFSKCLFSGIQWGTSSHKEGPGLLKQWE